MKRMIAGLSAIGLVFATALALAQVNMDQASATVRSKLATRCLIAVRHRPMESSAKQKPPISVWSMSMAASTVARSTSSAAMTATARQRPSSKCASWSSKTRSCFFSARWALRRIPRIHGYLNDNKVPQLFVASGADQWDDPKHFPWTMGFIPSYGTEAHIYARYILQNLPNSKIGVLYQNDDFGKDYLNGLRDGLGDKAAKMIVATQSYETTDPTVDSQVVALQASGADVLLTVAIPKFAAQAIRKVYDTGWKPTHFLTSVSNSVGTVMKSAGYEKGAGIISAAFAKDPTDPQWQDTPEDQEWLAFMKKYNASANLADIQGAVGYSYAQIMVAVLKACGDNLTRENVMKQATSLQNVALPMLLPGITLSTSATDFAPIKQMQLEKFDGATWKLFGEVIRAPAN
jgi:branched-chain amino acid transport system substrate-binding protein